MPRVAPTIEGVSDLAVFDRHLRHWVTAACEDWLYRPPPIEWYEAMQARLPPGLRATLRAALDAGVISTAGGHRFTVAGIPAGKGPYAWFSRNARGALAPNWEYFVQAAEYASVRSAHPDCEIGFEDRLTDVSVSRHGELLWYIEVKERVEGLVSLGARIQRHGTDGVDMDSDDRGNDPLRKAKGLAQLRPPYFSLVGIGGRLDHSVTYHDQTHFDLIPDLVAI